MKAVTNFLQLLNENWTLILIIIFMCVGFYNEVIDAVKKFQNASKEEKIKMILAAVNEEILKMMSDAEAYWAEFYKAGDIKRSQVISDVFSRYPILAEYADQAYIIKAIDDMIEAAKPTMDKIFAESEEEEEVDEVVEESGEEE